MLSDPLLDQLNCSFILVFCTQAFITVIKGGEEEAEDDGKTDKKKKKADPVLQYPLTP